MENKRGFSLYFYTEIYRAIESWADNELRSYGVFIAKSSEKVCSAAKKADKQQEKASKMCYNLRRNSTCPATTAAERVFPAMTGCRGKSFFWQQADCRSRWQSRSAERLRVHQPEKSFIDQD